MTGHNIFAVDSILVSEAWPAASSAEAPILYGHATITPERAFKLLSYQTFILTYSVGRFEIEDHLSIRVV